MSNIQLKQMSNCYNIAMIAIKKHQFISTIIALCVSEIVFNLCSIQRLSSILLKVKMQHVMIVKSIQMFTLCKTSCTIIHSDLYEDVVTRHDDNKLVMEIQSQMRLQNKTYCQVFFLNKSTNNNFATIFGG